MSGAAAAVSALLADYLRDHPAEAALAVEEMPAIEIAALLADQPPELAARILQRLRRDTAAEVVAALDARTCSSVLPAVEPGRAAAFLALLDGDDLARVLAAGGDQCAAELRALMSFPPDTAGSLMDPRVVVLRGESSAEQALLRLREVGRRGAHAVHVVDGEGIYLGRVGIQDLALAGGGQRLRELIVDPTIAVQATASQAEVVELMEQHQLVGLPVVDFERRLIGLIRNRTLVEAVEREATADIQTMVGVSRNERALSPVAFVVRKRLPWLQVNLLTAFLASFVVGLFEHTIAQLTALAVLLPVVAGQSGNTGAQALAVTMRGLALREIRVRHGIRVAVKELLAGAVNGLAVAAVTAAVVLWWSRSPGLAGVIGVAMVISMAVAGLAGALIPVLLTVAGQDPAQSSSIVLTTVTDVLGFLTFLGLATLAMGTM